MTHVKIQSTEEYFDLYGGEKFATLAELVEHYTDSQNSLRETNGQIITLKVPLYVEEVTNERCASLNCAGVHVACIQWNLSMKDTLNKGHLSNEDSVCCPIHTELCTNLPLN